MRGYEAGNGWGKGTIAEWKRREQTVTAGWGGCVGASRRIQDDGVPRRARGLEMWRQRKGVERNHRSGVAEATALSGKISGAVVEHCRGHCNGLEFHGKETDVIYEAVG